MSAVDGFLKVLFAVAAAAAEELFSRPQKGF